jgi:lipoprotein NlpI
MMISATYQKEIAVPFWICCRGTMTHLLPNWSGRFHQLEVDKLSVTHREEGNLRQILLALAAVATLLAACAARAQELDQLLQQAMQASERGEQELAIGKLSDAIKLSPTTALPWYLRGREHFRVGKISESVADFDKYIALAPDAANRQWERGISLYYAGEFDKGAKQFEDYQKYHNQDVENSAWRYLCVARASGVEKARANLLPITNDPRAPMMQIYALYQGKLKTDEVLTAAKAGIAEPATDPASRELLNQRLFYAHLYVGLWYETAGDDDLAKHHILEAEKHKIGHYMWDVAHVHAERLRAAEK